MRSYRTLARASVLAAAVALAGPATAFAQYVDVPPSPAYALDNVTVMHADGRRQEGVTVVIRGSMIEAIGPSVRAPADARVLEGENLVVYPGFVDANGEAEHEFPAPDIDRSEVEIWDAPRELQGFMPARRVVSYLTADGEAVADKRKQGIVAAAVHPTGAMMPGRGVLVLYRRRVEEPEALVIRPALGPKFELQGGRGVYPGTLFGVMAFFRQAFEDARYQQQVAAAYGRDPEGLTTPAYDPDYDVLQQVLENELPVYFEVDSAPDIVRVIRLSDEYGFDPVIVGGGEAWKVADRLRERNIPVLVDVDFTEPRRWDPDEEGDEPLDAAVLREKQSYEDLYSNAGRLAEAGLTFALTSGGSGEILEGVRKVVEYGLSPEGALRALTATPADLLGIPEVVRVAEGLPANLVVSSGPIFGEDASVAYTFVEGRLEEGEEPGAEAGDPDEAANVAGEWAMTIDADGQVMDGTMTLVQEGATFSGTIAMMGQDLEIRDGVINGNDISMVALMEQGGETIEIDITGTVDGDEASGQADSPMGMARWTAERRTPGGAR